MAVIFAISAFAQSKVAVFDPQDKDNTGYGAVIREMLSTGISKSGKYVPVERALISKVLEENKYQSTGMVDESKVSELGKQMGADFVCVSMMQKIGGNFFITVKLVNVTTASVEFQEYIKTTNGENDLFDKVDELAGKLAGAKPAVATASTKPETKPNVPTIEINFQTYMVLPKDLSGTYTWQQAKDACGNLSAFGYDDWVLPDKNELNALYENKEAIGGFDGIIYWSSTEYDAGNAWRQNFTNGNQYDFYKSDYDHVRCVRRN